MSVPAPVTLPLAAHPRLPALHPELGAVVLGRDPRRGPSVGALAALGVCVLPFLPALGLGVLVLAGVVKAVRPRPVALYEGGVAAGDVAHPWERCRSLTLTADRLELVFGDERFGWGLDASHRVRIEAWLRVEVLPARAHALIVRALGGERVALGGSPAWAVTRAGLRVGDEALGWDVLGEAELRDGALEVVAGDRRFSRSLDEEDAWSLAAVVAARRVAALLLRARESEEDPSYDDEELEVLARAGVASAQGLLGARLASSARGADEVARARVWLRAAADAGDPGGMLGLGRLLRDHARGAWERGEAAGWITRSAESGLPEAKLALAHLKEHGFGTDHREIEASDLLDEVVEAGLAPGRAAARRRALEEHLAGWARALGVDRPPAGSPDPHPELGPHLFTWAPEDGGGFSVHDAGVTDGTRVVAFGPYARLLTGTREDEHGDVLERARVEDDDAAFEVEVPGVEGEFFRWAFETLVARRIAARFLAATREGETFYMGRELQIRVAPEGVAEEVNRGGRTEEELVSWERYEGTNVVKGQVHVLARKPAGAHRAAVSMDLAEPNAWVLYAMAQIVEEHVTK